MEAEFIGERDSFYMATVGEGGWPYAQHRGGPRGVRHQIAGRDVLPVAAHIRERDGAIVELQPAHHASVQ
jgi:hypothetical protein